MADENLKTVGVRELRAREEIRQLPYRYAAAIENRDVDAMADLFVPHAKFGAITATVATACAG